MNTNRKRLVLFVACAALFLVTKRIMKEDPTVEDNNSYADTQKGIPVFKEVKVTKGTNDACSTVTDVVFVKTHKTAGSSLGRIMGAHRRRTGLRKRAQPFPAPHFGGYPIPFNINFTILTNTQRFPRDASYLLSGHMRFQKEEIRSIMSTSAKYITILRSPWRVFESAFYFYYGSFSSFRPQRVTSSCEFEPYLSVTKDFGVSFGEYIKLASANLDQDVAWYFRSKNFQSHDLGLDPMIHDEDYVMKHARDLDSVFDLVLITDYFLESLVLLKDVLCMEWEDLIAPRNKEGKYEKHVYSKEEEEMVQRINNQDFILYNYFNKTFWRKVANYGHERMARDVETLKHYIKKAESSLSIKDNELSVVEGNADKNRPNKRSVRRKRSLPDFVPKNKHVDLLVGRIYARSDVKNATDALTRRMAHEMVKYAGWCPY